MQAVVFLTTFPKRGIKSLHMEVHFQKNCIKRFLKAIVFLIKKVKTFFLIRKTNIFYPDMLVFFCCYSPSFQYNILRQ